MNAVAQLRASIRTNEALAEHYLAWLQGDYPATGELRMTLLFRRGMAMGRAARGRDQLANLSPTAETPASKPNTAADSSHELQPTGSVPDRSAVGE